MSGGDRPNVCSVPLDNGGSTIGTNPRFPVPSIQSLWLNSLIDSDNNLRTRSLKREGPRHRSISLHQGQNDVSMYPQTRKLISRNIPQRDLYISALERSKHFAFRTSSNAFPGLMPDSTDKSPVNCNSSSQPEGAGGATADTRTQKRSTWSAEEREQNRMRFNQHTRRVQVELDSLHDPLESTPKIVVRTPTIPLRPAIRRRKRALSDVQLLKIPSDVEDFSDDDDSVISGRSGKSVRFSTSSSIQHFHPEAVVSPTFGGSHPPSKETPEDEVTAVESAATCDLTTAASVVPQETSCDSKNPSNTLGSSHDEAAASAETLKAQQPAPHTIDDSSIRAVVTNSNVSPKGASCVGDLKKDMNVTAEDATTHTSERLTTGKLYRSAVASSESRTRRSTTLTWPPVIVSCRLPVDIVRSQRNAVVSASSVTSASQRRSPEYTSHVRRNAGDATAAVGSAEGHTLPLPRAVCSEELTLLSSQSSEASTGATSTPGQKRVCVDVVRATQLRVEVESVGCPPQEECVRSHESPPVLRVTPQFMSNEMPKTQKFAQTITRPFISPMVGLSNTRDLHVMHRAKSPIQSVSKYLNMATDAPRTVSEDVDSTGDSSVPVGTWSKPGHTSITRIQKAIFDDTSVKQKANSAEIKGMEPQALSASCKGPSNGSYTDRSFFKHSVNEDEKRNDTSEAVRRTKADRSNGRLIHLLLGNQDMTTKYQKGGSREHLYVANGQQEGSNWRKRDQSKVKLPSATKQGSLDRSYIENQDRPYIENQDRPYIENQDRPYIEVTNPVSRSRLRADMQQSQHVQGRFPNTKPLPPSHLHSDELRSRKHKIRSVTPAPLNIADKPSPIQDSDNIIVAPREQEKGAPRVIRRKQSVEVLAVSSGNVLRKEGENTVSNANNLRGSLWVGNVAPDLTAAEFPPYRGGVEIKSRVNETVSQRYVVASRSGGRNLSYTQRKLHTDTYKDAQKDFRKRISQTLQNIVVPPELIAARKPPSESRTAALKTPALRSDCPFIPEVAGGFSVQEPTKPSVAAPPPKVLTTMNTGFIIATNPNCLVPFNTLPVEGLRHHVERFEGQLQRRALEGPEGVSLTNAAPLLASQSKQRHPKLYSNQRRYYAGGRQKHNTEEEYNGASLPNLMWLRPAKMDDTVVSGKSRR
eukprot:Lankesteria_metandrocarpae@DN2296_c0_g1_i1.p1